MSDENQPKPAITYEMLLDHANKIQGEIIQFKNAFYLKLRHADENPDIAQKNRVWLYANLIGADLTAMIGHLEMYDKAEKEGHDGTD